MFKKFLPHIIAVAVLGLLTAVYFLPYYQGKTLGAHDTTQWRAMAQEIISWKEKTGEQALWTNSMFCGMPAFQISVIYSGNWIHHIIESLQIFFPESSADMFMMFVGFYILLLCFGVNRWLSLAGAIAYGLASFNLISIEAGHNTKVMAMALMAPALGGMVLAYRGKILPGGALTALFLSLNIDANHFQIAYYTLLTMGFLGVYFLVEKVLEEKIVEFGKASLVLIAAAGLAFVPNIANLWSTWEYGKQTMRGGGSELTEKVKTNTGGGLDYEYATRWSQGFSDGEIFTLLIPNLKGGASQSELSTSSQTYKDLSAKTGNADELIKHMPTYFGEQPGTSGPVYFGAAILFLAVLGLFIIKSPIKWALLIISLFFIFLSFGHNTSFFKFFFDYLPMFNKFRTPPMALVIPQLCFPLLAVLALNEIFKGERDAKQLTKYMLISAGILGAVILLFGVFGVGANYVAKGDTELAKYYPDWLIADIQKDRAGMVQSDSLRSLFFIAAAFGVLWLFIRKTISQSIFIGAIATIFLLDGWLVANRYLNSDDFQDKDRYSQNFVPSATDQQILQDKDIYYRVFDRTVDPFNTASPAYFHKLVGGYSPAKLQRIQDLIERQISNGNMKVFDMLNTKYFKVADDKGKEQLIPNPSALGNAWFVRNVVWVKNADGEMDSLTNFDPRTSAVVDEKFKSEVHAQNYASDSAVPSQNNSIHLTQYSPNKLNYEYTADEEKVAVFSDVYYAGEHGWKAFVDGKEYPHFRCNYILRAMSLPKGKHQIEFRFEPKSYYLGNKMAYAGSFLLLAFVLGTLGVAMKNKMKEWDAEPKVEVKKEVKHSGKPQKKK